MVMPGTVGPVGSSVGPYMAVPPSFSSHEVKNGYNAKHNQRMVDPNVGESFYAATDIFNGGEVKDIYVFISCRHESVSIVINIVTEAYCELGILLFPFSYNIETD